MVVEGAVLLFKLGGTAVTSAMVPLVDEVIHASVNEAQTSFLLANVESSVPDASTLDSTDQATSFLQHARPTVPETANSNYSTQAAVSNLGDSVDEMNGIDTDEAHDILAEARRAIIETRHVLGPPETISADASNAATSATVHDAVNASSFTENTNSSILDASSQTTSFLQGAKTTMSETPTSNYSTQAAVSNLSDSVDEMNGIDTDEAHDILTEARRAIIETRHVLGPPETISADASHVATSATVHDGVNASSFTANANSSMPETTNLDSSSQTTSFLQVAKTTMPETATSNYSTQAAVSNLADSVDEMNGIDTDEAHGMLAEARHAIIETRHVLGPPETASADASHVATSIAAHDGVKAASFIESPDSTMPDETSPDASSEHMASQYYEPMILPVETPHSTMPVEASPDSSSEHVASQYYESMILPQLDTSADPVGDITVDGVSDRFQMSRLIGPREATTAETSDTMTKMASADFFIGSAILDSLGLGETMQAMLAFTQKYFTCSLRGSPRTRAEKKVNMS